MVAVPSATPVTRPRLSTEATAVSLEVQPKAAASTTCPLPSVAIATSRTVPPAARVWVAGVISTVVAVCDTTIEAVFDTSPASAVTVARPFATAVTRPVVSTVATAVSPLDQATVASVIGRPIWSRTSADSRTVSSIAVSVAVSGATVTVAGAGSATSTAKLCVAESPPGSETLTVTAAAPRAPPVTDSSVPDRPMVATAGLDVVAT